MLCFLVMAVVHNVAESSIHRFSNQLTATLIFVAVSTPGRRSLLRAGSEQRCEPAAGWRRRHRQALN